MKTVKVVKMVALGLFLVALSAEGQRLGFGGPGETEGRTLLVVKADGSCVLSNQATELRKSLEQQVTMWERSSRMSEEENSEVVNAVTALARSGKEKALTDGELASKIREMYKQRAELQPDDESKLEAVEVSSNAVRLVTSQSFGTLKELLSQSPYMWGPRALMFEDARVEQDTNKNLRITFTANQAAARYARNFVREWKSTKAKSEWKLVLPGKIVSSGLPHSQDTATWLSVDGEKPETVDAALKLVAAPLVIVAEPGGLKVAEPLESKKLVQLAWKQRKGEPELPITDAGPGFLAEPAGITISTVHYFSEGAKYVKNRPELSMFGSSPTGAVVSAKLFPPKGREIRSVSGVRVKGAKDDKGRVVPGVSAGGEGQEEFSEYTRYVSDESDKRGAARIELRLGLPEPDAKAIDELEGEAIALTIGGWKEMTITNVQADAKKEIDLGEVVLGAKLIVKKLTGKKPQKTLEAALVGPKEVGQIEVKFKSNRRGAQSNSTERRSTTSGNTTTRSITVRAYEFGMGEEASSGPPTLVIRFPQDVKRERVRFKLTALDLL